MTVEVILGFGHPGDGKVGIKGGHDHRSSWGQSFLRILLTISTVAVSMVFPQFSAVMAFMGSFSAFMINFVGPVAAKVVLQGRCGILDGAVIAVSLVMTVWGTYAAFFATWWKVISLLIICTIGHWNVWRLWTTLRQLYHALRAEWAMTFATSSMKYKIYRRAAQGNWRTG